MGQGLAQKKSQQKMPERERERDKTITMSEANESLRNNVEAKKKHSFLPHPNIN